MLHLVHHSRSSRKLPKPYPGLPTTLGRTPDCPSRSWLLQAPQHRQRALAPWPVLRNISLLWAAHTFCHQVLQGWLAPGNACWVQVSHISGRWAAGEPWGNTVEREGHIPTREPFVFSSILFLPPLDLPLPKYCWVLAVLTHPHMLRCCRHINSQENATAPFPLLVFPPCSSLLWLPRQISCVDPAHVLQVTCKQKALVLDGNILSNQQFFNWVNAENI